MNKQEALTNAIELNAEGEDGGLYLAKALSNFELHQLYTTEGFTHEQYDVIDEAMGLQLLLAVNGNS